MKLVNAFSFSLFRIYLSEHLTRRRSILIALELPLPCRKMESWRIVFLQAELFVQLSGGKGTWGMLPKSAFPWREHSRPRNRGFWSQCRTYLPRTFSSKTQWSWFLWKAPKLSQSSSLPGTSGEQNPMTVRSKGRRLGKACDEWQTRKVRCDGARPGQLVTVTCWSHPE